MQARAESFTRVSGDVGPLPVALLIGSTADATRNFAPFVPFSRNFVNRFVYSHFEILRDSGPRFRQRRGMLDK